jgi:tetrapyrrole methylase family protein/MazG family protein
MEREGNPQSLEPGNLAEGRAFQRLFSIVKKLRSPEGCQWDREQTPGSLRSNLLEEAYECVHAIEAGDDRNLQEELGDLLLLVTMISWMMEEEGRSTMEGVLKGISEKLVRRHPHVFGDIKKHSVAEILEQWETIKAQEKGAKRDSVLDKVPKGLPPLQKAYKIQKEVGKVGFDWPEPGPVWQKLQEEIAELREAVENQDPKEIEAEAGDVLFTVVNLCRMVHTNPAVALVGSNRKFAQRFVKVERRLAEASLTAEEAGLSEMDRIWDRIKEEEGGS